MTVAGAVATKSFGDGVRRVTTGATVSRTVTVNEPVPGLLRASFDVQLTGVVPNANAEPDGGVHVTAVDPSTRSVADAPNVTTAPLDEVASARTFAGTVTDGPVVSTTVTCCVASLKLPEASVARHTIDDVPSAN